MKANMGTIDRAVRIFVALVAIGLYFAGQTSGLTAIILLIFVGVLILTSLISFCPLYMPFGITTRKKNN